MGSNLTRTLTVLSHLQQKPARRLRLAPRRAALVVGQGEYHRHAPAHRKCDRGVRHEPPPQLLLELRPAQHQPLGHKRLRAAAVGAQAG